jgi:hypothetical protein
VKSDPIDPIRWNAILTRDRSMDGRFVYGTLSTGTSTAARPVPRVLRDRKASSSMKRRKPPVRAASEPVGAVIRINPKLGG